jgi:ribosomal protein L11 methyltransferase
MKWIEIQVKTTGEASDAVSQMLMSMGSAGVAVEDPEELRREAQNVSPWDYADESFLKTLGEGVLIKAYFPAERNSTELIGVVKERLKVISGFLDTGECKVILKEVDEEDWSESWKKYYKPFYITEGVVVKPSWEDWLPEKDEVVIEMDPGMAFGTGTHDTTRMCAALAGKYLKKGDHVLDVGCGTGILSILSALLGAEKIEAVDIDSVAVDVARENCVINGVESIVNVRAGVLSDIDTGRFNLIIANIIADVIIDIAGDVFKRMMPGGLFITSGIIREREGEVLEKYNGLGFKLELIDRSGEWVAIVFRCPDSL